MPDFLLLLHRPAGPPPALSADAAAAMTKLTTPAGAPMAGGRAVRS